MPSPIQLPNRPHPAVAGATVALEGTFLRVVPSASYPNASIQFPAGGAATGLRTSSAAGGMENVQSYTLGTGANFGFQVNASPGVDGSPPHANDLIALRRQGASTRCAMSTCSICWQYRARRSISTILQRRALFRQPLPFVPIAVRSLL